MLLVTAWYIHKHYTLHFPPLKKNPVLIRGLYNPSFTLHCTIKLGDKPSKQIRVQRSLRSIGTVYIYTTKFNHRKCFLVLHLMGLVAPTTCGSRCTWYMLSYSWGWYLRCKQPLSFSDKPKINPHAQDLRSIDLALRQHRRLVEWYCTNEQEVVPGKFVSNVGRAEHVSCQFGGSHLTQL